MLSTVDLAATVEKADYKKRIDELVDRVRILQRDCREAGVPVVIVFEGWDAAGKGSTIAKLIERLDARGYRVRPTYAPNVEEALRPFLWRFWTALPGKGEWVLFDRSWYGRVLVERMEKIAKKREWERAYEEIDQFERALVDDGTVVLKFFLHISKGEQKKRLKSLENDPYTRWKVTKEDWRNHDRYKEWMKLYDEMLERTSTAAAPWTIVECEDLRFGRLKVLETVVSALEERLRLGHAPKVTKAAKIRANVKSVLDRVDLTKALDRDDYRVQLAKYQARLRELEFRLFKERRACMVVFEGWDAAGKGGAIRRLIGALDPRGYEVISIAAPQGDEKTHHYLWRFWKRVPKAGHLAIFDRSWYGRVLVERVEGFCREEDWRRAYQEINEFEGQLASYGILQCKFWVHISKAEQLRRFKEREKLDHKRYKITDEDWRNRKMWGAYEAAVGEMIQRTSTTWAPWTAVEGNDKYWARVRILKTVCETLEAGLG
jgi:AMP-polyphosphate phosphotransferase